MLTLCVLGMALTKVWTSPSRRARSRLVMGWLRSPCPVVVSFFSGVCKDGTWIAYKTVVKQQQKTFHNGIWTLMLRYGSHTVHENVAWRKIYLLIVSEQERQKIKDQNHQCTLQIFIKVPFPKHCFSPCSPKGELRATLKEPEILQCISDERHYEFWV